MKSSVTLSPTSSRPTPCHCGEKNAAALPVMVAMDLPHEIRHAAILGALDGSKPGRGIELVAPHDPLPLLAQIERRWPATFTVQYLERDTAWRLAITRGS